MAKKATKKTAKADTTTDSQVEAPKATKSEAAPIDVTQLTPAQLKALQKQLSEHKAVASSHREERNNVIYEMTTEKDEDGNFVNSTQDIAKVLCDNGLCEFLTTENFGSEDMKEEVQKEVRKIQARKQLLEKKTDEKGELVYPEGTFGYKSAGGGNSNLSASKIKVATVLGFFTTGRATELTDEQKTQVIEAINA